MINSLKSYRVVIIHEDMLKPDGVPVEVVAYTWTRRGGMKVRDKVAKTRGKNKWVTVFDNRWRIWWSVNFGTFVRYEGFDKEKHIFITRKIYWWHRERLWRTLWRIISGKHSRSTHRSTESTD